MPKIVLSDYGQSRTKLVPDDLERSPCLLTVATVERVDVPDENAKAGVRPALTLTFTEFPERTLWLTRVRSRRSSSD